jgi:uncharacterized Zn-binding protein involved in type VI secretion
MGTPAVVMGDKVTGTCAIHQIPNPASGAPQPSPPMPFSAPLLQGLVPDVLISGKPAAVMGSSGYNTPPHVGLHPSDPYMVPTMQEGRVVVGSATVLIGGKPAAKTGCQVSTCAQVPGTIAGTASTVLIGG